MRESEEPVHSNVFVDRSELCEKSEKRYLVVENKTRFIRMLYNQWGLMQRQGT